MKVGLVGNPNTGKTSLFNRLTGLNQKVGNYPGVTVDKKVGFIKLPNGSKAELIDLPGTYSINPASKDEEIVTESLTNEAFSTHPDVVVVVTDATNLKRNLLLFTQVADLNLPVILALNMSDVAKRKGIAVDVEGLQKKLGVPVVSISARKNEGIDLLKSTIENGGEKCNFKGFDPAEHFEAFLKDAEKSFGATNNYKNWLKATATGFYGKTDAEKEQIIALQKKHQIIPQRAKIKETIERYRKIDELINQFVRFSKTSTKAFTEKLDAIFTHRIFGFAIFMGILLLIFQAIFSWSGQPMEWIENAFGWASSFVSGIMPAGPLADLVTQGIIPGLAGVLVFIPQIAILFAFIALLEETGYMSRVVFLMDRIMRQFGLNGKSVVPLLSGMACAIPAVMATRNIENWKERLITILVTPFMTCSARLPVYTILIALVIPNKTVLGFFNLQGVVLMALYLFGFMMAIVSAVVFHKIFKSEKKSHLIMEMPPYKSPQWQNVGITILEKVKSFVFTAGKVILAISVVLWVLASYGPGNRKEQAVIEVEKTAAIENWDEETKNLHLMSARLENSYMGILGKTIEPTIKPLGYDWKIGIALLSSFAAREVFVGTMATIYSVGEEEAELGVKTQMARDINPETGKPRFTLAVAVSLLIFYALAMQCMSTLAVVYRETKGWKWPIIQFFFMTGLAYVLSLIAYQVLK